jgi:hypothetical protein
VVRVAVLPSTLPVLSVVGNQSICAELSIGLSKEGTGVALGVPATETLLRLIQSGDDIRNHFHWEMGGNPWAMSILNVRGWIQVGPAVESGLWHVRA